MRPSNWCRLGEAALVGHAPSSQICVSVCCLCGVGVVQGLGPVRLHRRRLSGEEPEGTFCGSVCQWWQTA